MVTHRFDNRALLLELESRGGRAWIFHGSKDLSIPSSMCASLAKMLGDMASYHEIA